MIFGLNKRHQSVERIIEGYASNHRIVDGAVGAAVNLVPFLPLAATPILVSAQAPLVYRPMSRKIAEIYFAPTDISFHDEADLDEEYHKSQVADFQNRLNNIQNGLFPLEFLLEIAKEIAAEAAVGNLIAAIPFFGMAASVAMDVMVAATMTWRVGLMTAFYCCNFEDWLGTRKDTYELSKKFVGPLSPKSNRRVDIGQVLAMNEDISEKHLSQLKIDFFDRLRLAGQSREQILESALLNQIPPHLLSRGQFFSTLD